VAPQGVVSSFGDLDLLELVGSGVTMLSRSGCREHQLPDLLAEVLGHQEALAGRALVLLEAGGRGAELRGRRCWPGAGRAAAGHGVADRERELGQGAEAAHARGRLADGAGGLTAAASGRRAVAGEVANSAPRRAAFSSARSWRRGLDLGLERVELGVEGRQLGGLLVGAVRLGRQGVVSAVAALPRVAFWERCWRSSLRVM
jgi:hypothetical protein